MPLKLALYLTFSILLTSCQSFFYYPSKQRYLMPSQLGLPYKDIHFHSLGGQCLHGWLIPHTTPGESKGTIVFFHGNAENISSHFLRLAWMTSYSYDLFVFDYQGYGKSPGTPSARGTVQDGVAALRWANDHNTSDSKKLVVYGHSLGGIVAMSVIQHAKVPLDYVILDATFDSYQGIAFDLLKSNWITWLFSPLAYVLISNDWAPESSKNTSAALIIHGTKDPVVPYKFGEQLYQKWLGPKCFWKIEDGNHGSIYEQDKHYRKRLIDFIEGNRHGC